MNKVLRQAVLALESLARSGAMTPPELAEAIEIPRSSGYRLAKAMVEAGIVCEDPDGRVRPSTQWMRWGDTARASMARPLHADRELVRLRDETGWTVFLCVPRPGVAVCVERIPGRSFDVLALRPGGSLPLHLGGVGRVLLAYADDVERYVQDAPFEPVGPKTLMTAAELREDVTRTLARGYAVSDEDVTIGVGAIGVPVLDAQRRCLAALSVAGPRSIVDDVDELSAALTASASRIGAAAEAGSGEDSGGAQPRPSATYLVSK